MKEREVFGNVDKGTSLKVKKYKRKLNSSERIAGEGGGGKPRALTWEQRANKTFVRLKAAVPLPTIYRIIANGGVHSVDIP